MSIETNNQTKKQLDEKSLEIARQIILESREPKLDADGYDPLDPYAKTAKKLDKLSTLKQNQQKQESQEILESVRKQREQEEQELRKQERKQQKEQEKLQQQQDQAEVDERIKDVQQRLKYTQAAQSVGDKENFNKYFRIIKLTVCGAIFLYSCMIALKQNYIEKENGVLVDENIVSELLGLRNLFATLKEIWFFLVLVVAVVSVRWYNNRLDEQELELLKSQQEDDKDLDDIQEDDEEEEDTEDQDDHQEIKESKKDK
eukprot:403338460